MSNTKKTFMLFALLLTNLVACAPIIPAPTETPASTATFTLLPELTNTPVPVTEILGQEATPTPTQSFTAIITPDAIQIERWREYQTALAESILFFLPPEEVLCEWEILGRTIQEVYIWAVCRGIDSGGSTPVVLHLKEDGTILNVEKPGSGSKRNANMLRMFPEDVREKFVFYNFGGAKKMLEHIEWRRQHPEEPPLIILSAKETLTQATATPTHPSTAFTTPNASQVERWEKYEVTLAKFTLPFLPAEEVLCEWDILGQSEQEEYIWAVCSGTVLVGENNPSYPTSSLPVVIYFKDDGTILDAKIPTNYVYDISRMFPENVQEKIFSYPDEKVKVFLEHLEWRQTHLQESPLIILTLTQSP